MNYLQTIAQEKSGQELFSTLVKLVTDPKYLPFFVYRCNEAEKDKEWEEDIRKGKDVSWKYTRLVLRNSTSFWSLHSNTHKGDQFTAIADFKNKLDHDQMKTLVMRVIERMVEVPMFPPGLGGGKENWHWTLLGTTDLAWRYLLDPIVTKHARQDRMTNLKLARTYDRWLALSRLREGRIFELPMWCGHCEFIRYRCDSYYNGLVQGNSFKISETLAPFSDYLRKLGVSNEEIAEEYMGWLTAARFNCRIEFFYAIAGDPVFQTSARPAAYEKTVQEYLQYLILGSELGNSKREMVERLVQCIGRENADYLYEM